MKLLDLFNKHISNEEDIIQYPYIIAEAGVNHENSIDIAYRLIDDAKEGGADAIKFQTYKANTIASKNSPAYWDTTKEPIKNQHDLFKKYDKFWKKEFEQLSVYCNNVDIEFISTPFDLESAKFLNNMMNVFKISSSDITNRPFIEYICDFRKPVILSTGASDILEIQEAVNWINSKQVPVSLLHCILNYPTTDENAHLGMIKDLKKKFPDKIIGYSDHTLPNDMKVLEMATLLGAIILEKHFTHDKTLPGNDHYHAMDKKDLKNFKLNLERIFSILGKQTKNYLSSEIKSRNNARRSLVATKDLLVGKIITLEDLTWKRPAHGISPKYIHNVIGKKILKQIAEDEVIVWDKLS